MIAGFVAFTANTDDRNCRAAERGPVSGGNKTGPKLRSHDLSGWALKAGENKPKHFGHVLDRSVGLTKLTGRATGLRFDDQAAV